MKNTFILVTLFLLSIAGKSYAQPQFLDSTFGTNGLVSGLVSQHSWVTDMAIQADGKIVCSYDLGNRFKLFRLKTNGTLDSTFGTNGFFDYDISSLGVEVCNSVALQTDGKIIAAGQAYIAGNSVVALMRINDNGTLDNSFGTSGVVTTNTGASQEDYGRKVLIRPDGKIVVAGFTNTLSSDDHFLLIQYNTNGTLDNTFGTNGVVSSWYSSSMTGMYDAALDANGMVVVVGNVYMSGAADVLIARYTTAGVLDAGFGTGGWVKYDLGSTSIEMGKSVLIQSTGKIIVVARSSNFMQAFIATRLEANGTIDNTFGANGHFKLNVTTSSNEFDEAILSADDKILLGGAMNVTGSDFEYGVLRLNADGVVDSSFGINGKITTDFFGQYDFIYAMGIQSDGKIVAAGSSRTVSTSTLTYPSLARYKKITQPSGVNTVKHAAEISVYPNPNTGTVYIKSNKAACLQVVDMQGRVMDRVTLSEANNFSVVINNLNTGIYSLQSEDGSIHQKLITTR